jgi:predicted transcriptional regulator
MRVDNHIHLRHIMLYHFEKGWSAAESFRDLKELFCQGTNGRATVYEWFDRFKSGNTSVDDEPGRGRPSEFDDKALLEAVEEDESLTTRMMADEFNVDQSTIVRHLKKLGKGTTWHVERHVVESIASKGWDLLPHPPYSPTEAPTDYHVNRSLKNWQTNKIYNDLDDLIDDVKAWIASKDRLFFARGIDRLPSKWQSVIDVGGEYAPE